MMANWLIKCISIFEGYVKPNQMLSIPQGYEDCSLIITNYFSNVNFTTAWQVFIFLFFTFQWVNVHLSKKRFLNLSLLKCCVYSYV